MKWAGDGLERERERERERREENEGKKFKGMDNSACQTER
jgi:hypothetical protein